MNSAPIHTTIRILREFRKIDPEFPLHYALCLLEIALDEGLSLSAMAERTGLSLSTASRIVGALSDHRQMGAPYGLVRIKISPAERRRKAITLTPRGRAYIDSLSELLAA